MSDKKKIVVFDVVEVRKPAARPGEVTRGSSPRERSVRDASPTRSAAAAALRAIEVEVDELGSNLIEFIGNVQIMLAKMSQAAGEFEVNQVEVQAQVNATGKVGFLGTGAEASGGASLKIVLQRRKPEA